MRGMLNLYGPFCTLIGHFRMRENNRWLERIEGIALEERGGRIQFVPGCGAACEEGGRAKKESARRAYI